MSNTTTITTTQKPKWKYYAGAPFECSPPASDLPMPPACLLSKKTSEKLSKLLEASKPLEASPKPIYQRSVSSKPIYPRSVRSRTSFQQVRFRKSHHSSYKEGSEMASG